jgi:type III secretory pathway component EscS
MKVNSKLVILLIVFAIIIIWLNNEIVKGNMSFYHGKDNGFIVRIESICFMSLLFFLIMSNRKRIILSILGFIIGFISSVFSYFISFSIINNPGISFHVLACTLFICFYFLITKTKTFSQT